MAWAGDDVLGGAVTREVTARPGEDGVRTPVAANGGRRALWPFAGLRGHEACPAEDLTVRSEGPIP